MCGRSVRVQKSGTGWGAWVVLSQNVEVRAAKNAFLDGCSRSTSNSNWPTSTPRGFSKQRSQAERVLCLTLGQESVTSSTNRCSQREQQSSRRFHFKLGGGEVTSSGGSLPFQQGGKGVN